MTAFRANALSGYKCFIRIDSVVRSTKVRTDYRTDKKAAYEKNTKWIYRHNFFLSKQIDNTDIIKRYFCTVKQ